MELPNGIVIKRRNTPQLLRYVNCRVKQDPENHYRERLMLFLPWRKEENLYGPFETNEEQFKAIERLLTIVRKKYEKHNEDLEGAIEEVENGELDMSDSDTTDSNHAVTEDKDDYGFFDPDRPREHSH